METKLLEEQIHSTIYRLAGYFELESIGELPKVSRENPPDRDASIWVRHWSFHNWITFPPTNHPRFYDWMVSEQTINHEASHYLHHQANPGLNETIKELMELENKGEKPEIIPYLQGLRELIAEYPNMIQGLNHYNKPGQKIEYEWTRKAYKKLGSKALPRIARMTVTEARKEGFLEGNYFLK